MRISTWHLIWFVLSQSNKVDSTKKVLNLPYMNERLRLKVCVVGKQGMVQFCYILKETMDGWMDCMDAHVIQDWAQPLV